MFIYVYTKFWGILCKKMFQYLSNKKEKTSLLLFWLIFWKAWDIAEVIVKTCKLRYWIELRYFCGDLTSAEPHYESKRKKEKSQKVGESSNRGARVEKKTAGAARLNRCLVSSAVMIYSGLHLQYEVWRWRWDGSRGGWSETERIQEEQLLRLSRRGWTHSLHMVKTSAAALTGGFAGALR